jgi:hypothetical protein
LGQGVPSDDALYFSHGLVRFSVLEFSPHFPGYPGFMLLGWVLRLIVGDPQLALGGVSIVAAALMPLAMAWAAWRLGGSGLAGYALGLTQPLLPALGIAFLSDSCGMIFMLIALGAAAPGQGGVAPRLFYAGVALGAALVCRPSYGPIIALFGLGLMISAPVWRQRLVLLGGGALVVVPLFAAVLAWEGWSYLVEGRRFLLGHTTVWGQTLWSESPVAHSWFETLSRAPLGGTWTGIIAVVCVMVLIERSRPFMVYGIGLLAAIIWTLTMQNPANPRHLAPVLFFALLLVACLPSCGKGWWRWGCIVLLVGVQGAATLSSLKGFPAEMPPVQRAANMLPSGALLITNHGVATLRYALPKVRVVDAVYAADAASALRTWGGGAVYWLRSTPLRWGDEWQEAAQFSARAWGEPSLWLYQRFPRDLP